jgi:ABC-type polysaccharide/polyol phosphate transport system ATPase subunit
MTQNPDSVVVFEKASVKYRSPVESYWSFKEYAVRLLQNRVAEKEYWALRDVSLEIARGEFFGIIGRNGAGKSTLLKLVSRVLAPTSGRVITRGFVAPMLELGAGFHYELTGRENVFLNGALLGHPQSEIKVHLSEILDFAQIESYIDAPLRTYSSGMVARLGFAVATSWIPEILILDEILAVGDEEFKKKCYERMKAFRVNGTTILLVSHSMETVQDLCTRAVWLEKGSAMAIGNVGEVIQAYRGSARE